MTSRMNTVSAANSSARPEVQRRLQDEQHRQERDARPDRPAGREMDHEVHDTRWRQFQEPRVDRADRKQRSRKGGVQQQSPTTDDGTGSVDQRGPGELEQEDAADEKRHLIRAIRAHPGRPAGSGSAGSRSPPGTADRAMPRADRPPCWTVCLGSRSGRGSSRSAGDPRARADTAAAVGPSPNGARRRTRRRPACSRPESGAGGTLIRTSRASGSGSTDRTACSAARTMRCVLLAHHEPSPLQRSTVRRRLGMHSALEQRHPVRPAKLTIERPEETGDFARLELERPRDVGWDELLARSLRVGEERQQTPGGLVRLPEELGDAPAGPSAVGGSSWD